MGSISASARQVRMLVIGAGSRGHAYASAITTHRHDTGPTHIPAIIAGVVEPNTYKRGVFGQKYIWGPAGRTSPCDGEEWTDWQTWVEHAETHGAGVDAIAICVLDEMHVDILAAVKGLGVHILCEKPLAPRLGDIQTIWDAYKDAGVVLGVCHVLRYSPHNIMLRDLVRVKKAIGDIVSVEHTEPVGWWHFSHSYVRGNWRKESKTAPSLMTKSCHDIDFLLWLMCSPTHAESDEPPHAPKYVASSGSRKLFRKTRKPTAAGEATNCLSCPIEQDCIYSARKIYVERRLEKGDTDWPVSIVNPEIEECYKSAGLEPARDMLLTNLKEDYSREMPQEEIDARPWFGRCVWESDNDVNDDQIVTMTWEDDPIERGHGTADALEGRAEKTAQFHMIAFTEKQCDRRGWIYGTKGEIEYDSFTIKVHDFATGRTESFVPKQMGGGHGGGDSGLARQFVLAVDAAINQAVPAETAQKRYLGCTLEEEIRSHAFVFAAEEARHDRKVVDWDVWWHDHVQA
ncbi:streptomycin biosynthesis protein StrI [Pseudovirgaria hyperparasitica]|uniref:Streptomycin biosynthesis protein StrI n=1 Tax=Pseudovirgaria hyperparasitica TaxID=470096 RepID=A0A6A6WF48_9PEZI|nr:streptomycin biosynthesis protein StrI [Pseudovirgaria hyperparasitica]KAF2761165.1 streptomycin biosynthesis protein StrI [Pseudovirgaria hyperparasitica]